MAKKKNLSFSNASEKKIPRLCINKMDIEQITELNFLGQRRAARFVKSKYKRTECDCYVE